MSRAHRQRDRAALPTTHVHETTEARALDALERCDYKQVLTILMRAYGDDIYRFCIHMVKDPVLAEDIRQITFVQAYQGLSGFSRQSTLRTWLYGIARHRCLDGLKKRRRFRNRFTLTDEVPEARSEPASPPEPEAPQRSMSQVLSRCLDKLKPKIRSTILLRYQQNLPYPEMATIVGERASTLQARVARAMPRLRRCVKAQGVEL